MALADSTSIAITETGTDCQARTLASIVSILSHKTDLQRLISSLELDLPEYESYEALRQQVYTAMTAGSEYFGFA